METYTKAQVIEILNFERGETPEYNTYISQKMSKDMSEEKLLELTKKKGIVLINLGYNRYYFA